MHMSVLSHSPAATPSSTDPLLAGKKSGCSSCTGVDSSYSLDQKWLVERTLWEMLCRI